ncbi:unnamed protein product [Leptosia nina]|uniref:Uncharacterized protein n=1 Tax=Leptosia nina TaxID=320188 RepID=A0AAV1JCU6_9NEOP
MPNLESNIFDKLLSNEILSMKQQIYERNATFPTTMQISTQRKVPTPLLELQQRWPIEQLQSNNEKKVDFVKYMENLNRATEIDEILEDDNADICKRNCNSSNDKVLKLRSLTHKLHKINLPSKALRVTKKCTCEDGVSKTRDSKSKKHRDHFLNQKENENDNSQLGSSTQVCSRTVPTSTITPYPFYITYSPYFIGTMVDYTNFYYHPDVIGDLKRPRPHNERKHKKPILDEDESDDEESQEIYYEYSQPYLDESTRKTAKHKEKTKSDRNGFTIYYTSNEQNSEIQENIQVVNKNKFVDEIVDDLKMLYNEAVIKDCYCSSCAYQLGLQIIAMVYLLQIVM